MLRLSPRPPPSPRAVRTLRTLHSTPASSAVVAHREWSPGDPILFGSSAMQRSDSQLSTASDKVEDEQEESAARGAGGKEWQPGESIRFGEADERHAATCKAGLTQQEQRNTNASNSIFRSSTVTTATRGSSPSSRPRPPPSSSTQSWPLSNRWDPPSPTPSSLSALSNGSTARFSLSRSYAIVAETPNGPVQPPRSPDTPSQLSQVELDELVAGVDFEDTSDLLKDAETAHSSRSPARTTQLAPEELDELLEGIDFSEEVGLSDEEVDAAASFDSEELFFTAVPSPQPPAPASPPSTKATRLITRNTSPTLAPSPPTQADVFSPVVGPPRSFSRAATASTPRRQTTTSASAPFSPVLPPSPAYTLPSRPYSTEAKGKGKIVIDLCDSTSSPPPRSSAAVNDPDRSEDSVILLPPKRRVSTQASAAPVQSSQSRGWFTRPASLRASQTKPPPSSTSAPPLAGLATSASTSNTSSSHNARRSRPAARSASSSAIPSSLPNLSRAPRPGSKRAKAEERQVELRQKWPREFSYKSFGGVKPNLVVSTDEGEIERVLKAMEGPLGFDLEWNPYVRGKNGAAVQGKTALAQVCDASIILLVQVSKMPRFPPALKSVIEDPNRIKLGVQIAGDATKLQRDFGHQPSGTLELNALVRTYDKQRLVNRTKPGLIGLQELTGIYLDRYLPKETDVRCGTWTATLSAEQIEYAANDVYASLHVLLAIQALSDKDIKHEDLAQLASRPYNSFYGFSRAPIRSPVASPGTSYGAPPGDASPSAATSDHSSPAQPPSPSSILAPRKLEAFNLFHLEQLSVLDISRRMSKTLPIKPSSVLWSLLSSFELMKDVGMKVEWDRKRLVEAADEVQWSPRMKAEHGALVEQLRVEMTVEE
ncbi:hypothetical protein JCM11251_005446 [Rhodosporidiobolus azoricus]